MPSIRACPLPEDALLSKYAQAGAYTDCLTTEICRPVSHAAYIEAFYTSRIFKLERLLLAWLMHKPSTDAQARALADQLLICDFLGYTRSWLMIAPPGDGGAAGTRLYFGTAVVPARDTVSGQATWTFSFRMLLPFHKLYARTLLYAARLRLERDIPVSRPAE